MAENSNNPKNLNMQNKGALNQHARSSSPSFDPRANQGKNRNNGAGQNVKNQFKRKLLTEGIKKGAQAYGVPESATQAILDSDTGKEAMDAAVNAPSIASGAKEAAGVIAKRELIKLLPVIIAPFLLILLFAALIFSKDTFGGMGDGTDIYEDLRKEIAKTMQNYKGITDIDGTLILATLIGYSDVDELDDPSSSHSIAQMKSKVYDLATYQVMTTKACDYDSLTMRKIASNDDLLGEANYNCVADVEGESYKTSIEEGDYNDDNSGSVYYWNLIDEGFIFDYYNDYMIDPNNQYSNENDKKIEEIISEIYAYYEVLKEASEGNDYFSMYITGTGYWWPIGSEETTSVGDKEFAKGEPISIQINSEFGYRTDPFTGKQSFHGGLDIGRNGRSDVKIIATKDGVVLRPLKGASNSCPSNDRDCGGGYGNYVLIDHGDGTQSLYAHLLANSITVKAGDVVSQGQVIGIMGTSGNSTGIHLHFEIRENGERVDPLLYVDPNNPRPIGGNDSFFSWVSNIECSDCETRADRVDGDNYIVYKTNTGSLDVAYGIQLTSPNGTPQHRYPDIYDGPVEEGTRIPKDVVRKIFDREVSGNIGRLLATKAKYGVVFSQNQEHAILSLIYNTGPNGYLDEAVRAFKDGGAEGYWNYTKKIYRSRNSANECGLKIRRSEEYELFKEADYQYDPLDWSCGTIKYYDVQDW